MGSNWLKGITFVELYPANTQGWATRAVFCRQGYTLAWPGWQVLSTEKTVLHYHTQKNQQKPNASYVWNHCVSIKLPVRFTPPLNTAYLQNINAGSVCSNYPYYIGVHLSWCKPRLRARNCIDFSVSLIACSHLTIQIGAPYPAYYPRNLSFSRNTSFVQSCGDNDSLQKSRT